MAKKGNALGFSTINGSASNYFMFITGATTVSGIFLCLFGLTAFSNILVHDNNVTMWTVLKALQLLPNPLDFIRDCTQIVNAFGEMVKSISTVTKGTGNAILDFLASLANMILSIAGYVLMLIVSIVLLPAYFVFFFLRCVAVFFTALGFQFNGLNILMLDWVPVETIINMIKGV